MSLFPNAATFFVVYESVKRAGEAKFADSPAALHLIAGAAGRQQRAWCACRQKM